MFTYITSIQAARWCYYNYSSSSAMDSSSIASPDKKETTTKKEQIQLHKANKDKILKQNLLFANLQVLH